MRPGRPYNCRGHCCRRRGRYSASLPSSELQIPNSHRLPLTNHSHPYISNLDLRAATPRSDKPTTASSISIHVPKINRNLHPLSSEFQLSTRPALAASNGGLAPGGATTSRALSGRLPNNLLGLRASRRPSTTTHPLRRLASPNRPGTTTTLSPRRLRPIFIPSRVTSPASQRRLWGTTLSGTSWLPP